MTTFLLSPFVAQHTEYAKENTEQKGDVYKQQKYLHFTTLIPLFFFGNNWTNS